jgi:hypothetical protein
MMLTMVENFILRVLGERDSGECWEVEA